MSKVEIKREIYKLYFEHLAVSLETWNEIFSSLCNHFNFSSEDFLRDESGSRFEDSITILFYDYGISWRLIASQHKKIVEIGVSSYLNSLEMICLISKTSSVENFSSCNQFLDEAVNFLERNQSDLISKGKTKYKFPIWLLRENYPEKISSSIDASIFRLNFLAYKVGFLKELKKRKPFEYLALLEGFHKTELAVMFQNIDDAFVGYETILSWTMKVLDIYALLGFPQRGSEFSEVIETVREFVNEEYLGIAEEANEAFLNREDYKSFFLRLDKLYIYHRDLKGNHREAIFTIFNQLAHYAENEFRLLGKTWEIRFSGKLTKMRDLRGLKIVHLLLSNPGQEFELLEISSHLDGVAVPLSFGARENKELSLNETTKWQAETTSKRLKANKGDSGEYDSNAISEMANKLLGLGDYTKLSVEHEKLRKALSKNVDKAIAEIKAQNKELGMFLNSHITKGNVFSYKPSSEIKFLLK